MIIFKVKSPQRLGEQSCQSSGIYQKLSAGGKVKMKAFYHHILLLKSDGTSFATMFV